MVFSARRPHAGGALPPLPSPASLPLYPRWPAASTLNLPLLLVFWLIGRRHQILRQHIKAVHQKLQPFACQFSGCGKKFPYRHVRDNHQNSGVHVFVQFGSIPVGKETSPCCFLWMNSEMFMGFRLKGDENGDNER
ncbi:hypothetical protein C4D60_Mb01t10090 [Musa balbisiana]|uniref:C2H2-type domain-containing protein n=1 Tax=Musa balbisiana TaxID=52838 RepID=A0A4V4H789_MUSBA|nr:hypothetical protein C4D60_Mb01t10090 [Musa balbisiana]